MAHPNICSLSSQNDFVGHSSSIIGTLQTKREILYQKGLSLKFESASNKWQEEVLDNRPALELSRNMIVKPDPTYLCLGAYAVKEDKEAASQAATLANSGVISPNLSTASPSSEIPPVYSN